MPNQAPADDQTISNDDVVYRRARNDQIVHDSAGHRISSAVVKSNGGPLSADLGSLCSAQETRNRSAGDFHVVAVPVAVLRAAGCRLQKVPDGPDKNPAHVHIYGSRDDGGLTTGQAGRVAKECWVVATEAPAQSSAGPLH